ncbi:hypothetical protein HYO62_03385 [Aerococcaceae bacterium DSM 111022]|nr:hypothetical protein [Aerococcaceae bacterium DSM 111022]
MDNGRMTRYLSFREMLGWIPQMESLKPRRVKNIKGQIYRQLDEISGKFDNYLITDEIMYQKEQVDFVDDPDQLRQALSQLVRQKPKMIKTYEKQIELYRQMPEQ